MLLFLWGVMQTGEMIRQALLRAGKTQDWLAAEIGVTRRRVTAILASDNLEVATLRRIHAVLPIPELRPLMEPAAPDSEAAVWQCFNQLSPQVQQRLRAVWEDKALREQWVTCLEAWIAAPPETRQALSALLLSMRSGSAPGKP